MNSYDFWDNYNKENISRIERLLTLNKNYIRVDLHNHSDYSVDGEQTVKHIIDQAIEMDFEIISITDHDSVRAYDELAVLIREYSVLNIKLPIIITGIEFTVNYEDYGSMCHVLKYGINPASPSLDLIIKKNEAACWMRATKQFKRIFENQTLRFFSEKYNILFSLEEYKIYLQMQKVPIPEYPSLIDYIFLKMEPHQIKLKKIISQLYKATLFDKCEDRKQKKIRALNRFIAKYNSQLNRWDYKSRLLAPLFATVGIDDADYPDHISSGNLSINEYGQVHITELTDEGVTVFAHPNGDKLHLMNECLNIGGKMAALELNSSNRHALEQDIFDKAMELGLFLTRGSDNHGVSKDVYGDLSNFNLSISNVRSLYQALKQNQICISKM
ncbi:PHP domain-containing protein [Paenibacillus sp. ClWae2A]|uniref:PHP domain-containing protein n=1 Tax=Paenibacillus sp. ClWae2A TaxID=3057177 RepID=UPI0028F57B61|nr:PHP domain-containing protein [Paenibacillus sp. ClWae2A]MDT9722446.1 PHP domain-containing protein [Paenibacillus sp. ClWae2A]